MKELYELIQHLEKYEEIETVPRKQLLKELWQIRETLKEQLLIPRVIFCLPEDGQTFEKWVHKNFKYVDKRRFECKYKATISYSETDLINLYSFLTDRLIAN